MVRSIGTPSNIHYSVHKPKLTDAEAKRAINGATIFIILSVDFVCVIFLVGSWEKELMFIIEEARCFDDVIQLSHVARWRHGELQLCIEIARNRKSQAVGISKIRRSSQSSIDLRVAVIGHCH